MNIGKFDSKDHRAVQSEDGSFTAYSEAFDEHYHSTKDGALHESLYKHVLPALKHCEGREEIRILDICFGLGFNTLATLDTLKGSNQKVHIISPEFDRSLIEALPDFTYPDRFAPLKPVIEALAKDKRYEDEYVTIELFIGDARELLRNLKEEGFKEKKGGFDVVYQDAFSPSSNPILWTKEYFSDISDLIREDGILTTYSTALRTRIALYENGFNVYLHRGEGFRNATLASKGTLAYEAVDMPHKMNCNPDVTSLRDSEIRS